MIIIITDIYIAKYLYEYALLHIQHYNPWSLGHLRHSLNHLSSQLFVNFDRISDNSLELWNVGNGMNFIIRELSGWKCYFVKIINNPVLLFIKQPVLT